jgi:hypothetical protein
MRNQPIKKGKPDGLPFDIVSIKGTMRNGIPNTEVW